MASSEILPIGESKGEEDAVHSEYLKQNTSHQVDIGQKPKRKHFFSQLDPAIAEAVHRDAEVIEYSAEEEVCLAMIVVILSRLFY